MRWVEIVSTEFIGKGNMPSRNGLCIATRRKKKKKREENGV